MPEQDAKDIGELTEMRETALQTFRKLDDRLYHAMKEAGLEDTQRLDWLESSDAKLYRLTGVDPRKLCLEFSIGSRKRLVRSETLRQAIDAGRQWQTDTPLPEDGK